MLKQAVGKGLLGQRFLIPQHARYKANRRVDQDLSGDLSSGQDIVADADFLDPAGVRPAAVREIELTDVILLLVASGRGVAVLPDWVLAREAANPDIATLRLGRPGVTRRLYAAVRAEIRACRLCSDRFAATATGHRPRPVPWLSAVAPILRKGTRWHGPISTTRWIASARARRQA